MRVAILSIGVALLIAGTAAAQRSGVSVNGAHGSAISGSARIAPPATPWNNAYSGSPALFPARLGANIAGHPYQIPGISPARPAPRPPRRPRQPYYPPTLLYGGYVYNPPRPVNVVFHHYPPPQPAVIINQNYTVGEADPVVREYKDGELPAPSRSSMRAYHAPSPVGVDQKSATDEDTGTATVYLIAMKDHTIAAATKYWVGEDTLHFIDTRGKHHQVSRAGIDAGFSERLNAERNVAFRIE